MHRGQSVGENAHEERTLCYVSDPVTSVPRSEAEDGTRGRQDELMKIGLHLEEAETLNKEQIGKLRQFWSKLQELGGIAFLGEIYLLHWTVHSIVLGIIWAYHT